MTFLGFKYDFFIFGNIFCFSSRRWAARGSQGTLFTGQFPGIGTSSILASLSDVQNAKARPTNKSGRMWGEAAGVCGVWREFCDEVNGGRGLAIEIVNAACVRKAVHLEIREEVAAWAKRCRNVTCFGSGEGGDEGGGFLTPTASHFDS